MKKILLSVMVVMATVFSFTSCENENDPNLYCYEFTAKVKVGNNAENVSTSIAKMTVADKNAACKAGTNEVTILGVKTVTTTTARKVSASQCE